MVKELLVSEFVPKFVPIILQDKFIFLYIILYIILQDRRSHESGVALKGSLKAPIAVV